MGLHSKRPSLSQRITVIERSGGGPARVEKAAHRRLRLSGHGFVGSLEGFVRRRIAAAAVLAVGLALGTAGCTFSAPQATLIKYDPSDGVSLDVGKIADSQRLRDRPEGQSANLIGVFINSGKSAERRAACSTRATPAALRPARRHVHMAAGQVISFGNPGVPQRRLRRCGCSGRARSSRSSCSTEASPGKNVLIPVLNGSQSYYKGLGPSPLRPTHRRPYAATAPSRRPPSIAQRAFPDANAPAAK